MYAFSSYTTYYIGASLKIKKTIQLIVIKNDRKIYADCRGIENYNRNQGPASHLLMVDVILS